MSIFKKLFNGVKEANKTLKDLEWEEREKKNNAPKPFEFRAAYDMDYPEPQTEPDLGEVQRTSNIFKFRVLALIQDRENNRVIGYRVMDEVTTRTEDIRTEQFIEVSKNQIIVNGKMALRGFETEFDRTDMSLGLIVPMIFVPTDGTSIKKYPHLSASTMLIFKNNPVIVRARIVEPKTNNLQGFLITNGLGQLSTISVQGLVDLQTTGYLNVKLVVKDGKPIFQALKGNIPDILTTVVAKGDYGLHEPHQVWVQE